MTALPCTALPALTASRCAALLASTAPLLQLCLVSPGRRQIRLVPPNAGVDLDYASLRCPAVLDCAALPT